MKISALPRIYKMKEKLRYENRIGVFILYISPRSIYMLNSDVINLFIFSFCILIHSVCTAILIYDIRNNNIRLFNHPSVPIYDGVFERNFFKLRINNQIKPPFLIIRKRNIQIRCYPYQLRIFMFFLKFFRTTIGKPIKTTISSKKTPPSCFLLFDSIISIF